MKTVLASIALPIAALIVLASTLLIAEPTNADNADTLKDPLVAQSATGFYGVDATGYPIPDRSGIMLVFDAVISPSAVSTQTFIVTLDDGENAKVLETSAHETLVFLKLENSLTSNATPNTSSVSHYFPPFELNDGIPPTLTMSLSGGSGTSTGDEGPDRLTKDKIDITVTSDEPLAEPPRVTVVCNDIQWIESVDAVTVHRNIDNFLAHRSGHLTENQSSNLDAFNAQPPNYRCGADSDLTLTTDSMAPASETSWTYEWRNSEDAQQRLNDGLLTAVAHARDESEYQRNYDGETIHNFGSASASFTLDTILRSPLEPGRGYTYPTNGSFISDRLVEPYVWIELEESTTVTVNSFTYDNHDITGFTVVEPDPQLCCDTTLVVTSLRESTHYRDFAAPGIHVISVDAFDAAANHVQLEIEFEILDSKLVTMRRDPFVLTMSPGWNAISLPSLPRDQFIDQILGHKTIRTVFGEYDSKSNRWSAAVRRDDGWHPVIPFDFLDRVSPGILLRQNDGYWVYASQYVEIPVSLHWPTFFRHDSYLTEPLSGWNFVGVTAEGRHHTSEVAFGSDLTDANDRPITVATYLNLHMDTLKYKANEFKLAFRWDSQTQSFSRLLPDEPVRIGEAIWVYYGKRAKTRCSTICP